MTIQEELDTPKKNLGGGEGGNEWGSDGIEKHLRDFVTQSP